MTPHIAILGEYDSSRPARATIGSALEHSAQKLKTSIEYSWISEADAEQIDLQNVDGLFIAPGGPAESSDNIIRAIQVAREEVIPCLGTCGGFQRIVSEYATNVLEIENIEHQESTPDAINPFFSALQCSLAGNAAEVMLVENSQVEAIYAKTSIHENFFCSYGINDSYLDRLQSHRLRVSGYDQNGEARIVELQSHPFFIGTLFVPQVASSLESPHPIVTAFLAAAIANRTLSIDSLA